MSFGQGKNSESQEILFQTKSGHPVKLESGKKLNYHM